jgi:uncharacterized membrane protein YcaP (DUF421 family)
VEGGFLYTLFAEDSKELGPAPMAARALAIFVFTIVLVRLAKKRFLARQSALDVILGIMLGSMLSRAVNGSARVLPTLAASAAIVLAHGCLGWLATRSRKLDDVLKGRSVVLVEDGRVREERLRAAHLTREDLMEDLRYVANLDDLADVREARLERNGKISAQSKERRGA